MAASMDVPAVVSSDYDDWVYDDEYDNAKWCCRFRECPCNSNNIYNNSTISLAPEDAKYQATVFFQDFRFEVGPNTNMDINTLKTIYESYTAEYSPQSDDIITRFYFEDLSLRVNNNNVNPTDNDNHNDNDNSNARGTLEYNMLFESRTVDVSNYHELFQQWTVDHSEKVLEDWQQAMEGWNITELDDPMWASSMEGPPPPPMVYDSAEENFTTSGGGRVEEYGVIILVLAAILLGICSCFSGGGGGGFRGGGGGGFVGGDGGCDGGGGGGGVGGC